MAKENEVKIRRGLKTYSVPVDENGYVPMWAIAQRYLEAGSRSDRRSTDERTLPSNLTPQEIADWWVNPGCCDVEGVDTEDAEIFSVPLSVVGRKRKALKNLAVLAEKKEAHRIKKVLARSFSADELELMTEGKSLLVKTEPHLDDCTGYYLRVQDGVPVPSVVIEDGTTPDGIVHEATHHLRAKDGRTAFPTDSDGRLLDREYFALSKKEQGEIIQKEERETVAETVARTKVDDVQSGYYDDVPGRSSRSAYLEDQRIVSHKRALTGKAAIKAAQANFERSNICRAMIVSANKWRKR